LKLKCDKLLSSFGFNFNLRRYIKVAAAVATAVAAAVAEERATSEVGHGRH